MGIFRIKIITRFFAWTIAALLLYLNLKLVLEEGVQLFGMPGFWIWKILRWRFYWVPSLCWLYFVSSLDKQNRNSKI